MKKVKVNEGERGESGNEKGGDGEGRAGKRRERMGEGEGMRNARIKERKLIIKILCF